MSLANWWSRLAGAECAECGQPVPAFARACGYCSAANRTRVAALAVAGALGFLAIAAVIAVVVVASWERLPVDEATTSPPGGDFAWLTSAMQECDAVAAKEPDTLHFLVIPLAAAPVDLEDWRASALNKIGNAILLRSDAVLAGLKDRTLVISKEPYALFVRDQAGATYNWDRTVGVAKFSVPKAETINGFYVQFQYGDKTTNAEWGNAFTRKKGNCYWVNAILAS